MINSSKKLFGMQVLNHVDNQGVSNSFALLESPIKSVKEIISSLSQGFNIKSLKSDEVCDKDHFGVDTFRGYYVNITDFSSIQRHNMWLPILHINLGIILQ